MAFNLQELKNLDVFLRRVDLKGNESMAHAELRIKILGMIEAEQNPPPAQKPEDKDVGTT